MLSNSPLTPNKDPLEHPKKKPRVSFTLPLLSSHIFNKNSSLFTLIFWIRPHLCTVTPSALVQTLSSHLLINATLSNFAYLFLLAFISHLCPPTHSCQRSLSKMLILLFSPSNHIVHKLLCNPFSPDHRIPLRLL